MEENRLQDIPQFRTLEENLELRVALQQVDKLKSENIALKAELDEWKDEIMQMPGVVERPDEDVEDLVMPESLQKAIDEYDYEAACQQAEIEEARKKDEFFSDFTSPSYDDVVDPEFDRGFDMAYDKALYDVIQYLKSIRNLNSKGKA